MLLLLPPALLLPLLPDYLIPYLLLPLGIAPPLFFHPNLTPFIHSLPRSLVILTARAFLEDLALTDALPDDVGRSEIGKVEVWENERLDPSLNSKSQTAGTWSSRFLRAGERAPWVKITNPTKGESLWRTAEQTSIGEGEKMILALEDGWGFIPGEDWRVDVCGFWSEVGVDEEGWAYSDDSWQVGLFPYSEL